MSIVISRIHSLDNWNSFCIFFTVFANFKSEMLKSITTVVTGFALTAWTSKKNAAVQRSFASIATFDADLLIHNFPFASLFARTFENASRIKTPVP